MKLLVLLLLVFSCSSKTLIKTEEDVKIYIDGEFKSRGSYEIKDTKIIFSDTNISLSKEDCRPIEYVLEKNEKINTKALLFSFLLLPLFWIFEYEELHEYKFECQTTK